MSTLAFPQPLVGTTDVGGVRRILALDPGRTTGYAAAYYSPDRLSIGVDQHVWTPRTFYDWIKEYLHESNAPTSIIYETFEYRNKARTGLDLTPVKLIGVLEIFVERHAPLVDFTKQSAAAGKAFYTDEKLKLLGAHKPGCPHGNDATRHLLQWATFGAGAQWIDMQHCEIILS